VEGTAGKLYVTFIKSEKIERLGENECQGEFFKIDFFEDPWYVPRENEEVIKRIDIEGEISCALGKDWVDAWGVHWVGNIPGDWAIPFPKVHPLKDIEQLDDYSIPSPDYLKLSDEDREFLRGQDRENHIIIGYVWPLFLFERAKWLMGIPNLMRSFFTHPKEVKRLFHRIADFNIQALERFIDLFDGVLVTEDLGHQKGLFISPKFFREFLVPEYRRCFKPLLKEEKMILFHSCGCVQDIIEDFIDLGVTILNPVQARANDLKLIKRKAEGRLALWGGIDTQHVLTLGTPEEVQKEVKRVINILAPGGGYIISPDQNFPIPKENERALWTTAEKYGKYPIRTTIMDL